LFRFGEQTDVPGESVSHKLFNRHRRSF
jgi:hypothetical protein